MQILCAEESLDVLKVFFGCEHFQPLQHRIGGVNDVRQA